jgi:hypothetical protein
VWNISGLFWLSPYSKPNADDPKRRYLQQLVAAQANRNRELETQLSQYRTGPNNAHGGKPNEMGLLLQPDAWGGYSAELASMREEDDLMDHDQEEEEGRAGMSPSVESEESAGAGGVEEERGRRGRDGRVREEGVGARGMEV